MSIHASTPGDYAAALLQRGYGVQSVALICGMHVDQVRPMETLRPQRATYSPPPKPSFKAVVVAERAGQSPREAYRAILDAIRQVLNKCEKAVKIAHSD